MALLFENPILHSTLRAHSLLSLIGPPNSSREARSCFSNIPRPIPTTTLLPIAVPRDLTDTIVSCKYLSRLLPRIGGLPRFLVDSAFTITVSPGLANLHFSFTSFSYAFFQSLMLRSLSLKYLTALKTPFSLAYFPMMALSSWETFRYCPHFFPCTCSFLLLSVMVVEDIEHDGDPVEISNSSTGRRYFKRAILLHVYTIIIRNYPWA